VRLFVDSAREEIGADDVDVEGAWFKFNWEPGRLAVVGRRRMILPKCDAIDVIDEDDDDTGVGTGCC
jgi:hypothetical protein